MADVAQETYPQHCGDEDDRGRTQRGRCHESWRLEDPQHLRALSHHAREGSTGRGTKDGSPEVKLRYWLRCTRNGAKRRGRHSGHGFAKSFTVIDFIGAGRGGGTPTRGEPRGILSP